MKSLTLALFLVSANSFAYTAFTCKELNVKNQRTVTLQQIGNDRIIEGKKIPFQLTVFKAPVDGREVAEIQVAKIGTVQTEDVVFDFTSNDKTVAFGIFMDELDQSWLKIGKAKSSQFECFSL